MQVRQPVSPVMGNIPALVNVVLPVPAAVRLILVLGQDRHQFFQVRANRRAQFTYSVWSPRVKATTRATLESFKSNAQGSRKDIQIVDSNLRIDTFGGFTDQPYSTRELGSG